MLPDRDGVGGPGDGRPRPPSARARYRRPGVWLPPLALAVAAGILAAVVEPWPEGRILVTLHGLGPRGITTSDVVLIAAVVAVSLAWLRVVSARQSPGTRSDSDRSASAAQGG